MATKTKVQPIELGRYPIKKGYVSWNVVKTTRGFNFGCGAVKLTNRQVKNFIKRLEILRDQNNQVMIDDYNLVANIVASRICRNLRCEPKDIFDPKKLTKFFKFEENVNKTKKKSTKTSR